MNATDPDPAALPLGNAILAAVLAEPEADLHRLAYAGLCEEAGDDARAEFIRVQCELAGWHTPPGSGSEDWRLYTRLRWRERELLAGHGRLWFAGLLPLPSRGSAADVCWTWFSGYGEVVGEIRRGFVAEAALPCDAWVAHGPALVRAAPLGRVTLSDRRPQHDLTGAGEEYWAWGWYAGLRGDPPPGCLPGRLWRDGGALGRRYPSEASALADASRMALAWARAAAGLPPLPAPGGRAC